MFRMNEQPNVRPKCPNERDIRDGRVCASCAAALFGRSPTAARGVLTFTSHHGQKKRGVSTTAGGDMYPTRGLLATTGELLVTTRGVLTTKRGGVSTTAAGRSATARWPSTTAAGGFDHSNGGVDNRTRASEHRSSGFVHNSKRGFDSGSHITCPRLVEIGQPTMHNKNMFPIYTIKSFGDRFFFFLIVQYFRTERAAGDKEAAGARRDKAAHSFLLPLSSHNPYNTRRDT